MLTLLVFQLALLYIDSGGGNNLITLICIIGGPYALNAEVKGPGNAICQPDTDRSDLLAQHLGLGLDHKAMVRAHEVIPLDQHRLPLAGAPREQPVLVQVRRHDGLGLYVDQVAPLVGADAQGEVGVHVDVEEGLAEERGLAVEGAPGGVARAVDVELGGGQLGRDGAVEARVAGALDRLRHGLGLRDPVQGDLRVAADVPVA